MVDRKWMGPRDARRLFTARHSPSAVDYAPTMIFRSPFPDVEIPDVPLTEFVLGGAAGRAERPALIDGVSGRVLTYAQLAGAVRAAAAGLARRGFLKGEVLALFSPNLPEYVIAFHAVAALGGVVTPVNPMYTAEELGKQLGDSGA